MAAVQNHIRRAASISKELMMAHDTGNLDEILEEHSDDAHWLEEAVSVFKTWKLYDYVRRVGDILRDLKSENPPSILADLEEGKKAAGYYVEMLTDGQWVLEDEYGTLIDGPFENRVDAIRIKKELMAEQKGTHMASLKSESTRLAGLGKDFVQFIHEVLKQPQGQMRNKVNRLRQRFGNDWDEIGKTVLIEMGGELNMLSAKNNSTEAAVRMVAAKYGMEPELVKRLFYATGAPFQYSGAKFEMNTVKESKAAVLRQKLRSLESKGEEWEVAKGDLLHDIAALRIRPNDKRTMQDAIKSANSYEDAESSLIYMEMAHHGMRAEPDLSPKSPKASKTQIIVNSLIPWNQKELILRAQKAARRYAAVVLRTDPRKGLYVVGDHELLARVGLARPIVSSATRLARSMAQVVSSQFYQHLDGSITGEVFVLLPKDQAIQYGDRIASCKDVQSVLIWDISGSPYLCQRS